MRLAFKSTLAVMAGAALLLAIAVGQYFRFFEQTWFHFGQWREADQREAASLWLPDYRAEIQAQPVEGIEDDLSALTFDPDRNSLIAITNGNPQLLELSLDGKLLRAIALVGFGDPEAIEYVSPGVYVVSDERPQRLLRVEVDEQTRVIDAATSQQLSLGIGQNGNKGFEGLAYDVVGKRLFVAKERDPVRIYEVQGFPMPLVISRWRCTSPRTSSATPIFSCAICPACSTTSRPGICWRSRTSHAWWSSSTSMANPSARCRCGPGITG